jgi:hypothetical protein
MKKRRKLKKASFGQMNAIGITLVVFSTLAMGLMIHLMKLAKIESLFYILIWGGMSIIIGLKWGDYIFGLVTGVKAEGKISMLLVLTGISLAMSIFLGFHYLFQNLS